jgi:hypothetical protein
LLLVFVLSEFPLHRVQRDTVQHAFAQQGEPRFAIHLALYEFEAVDLGFGLVIAPFHCQASLHGSIVPLQPCSKPLQLRNAARLHVSEPVIECLTPALPHEISKCLG